MSGPTEFRSVTSAEPCVICGKGDWCRRTADGAHECHRMNEPTSNEYGRVATTPAGFAVYRVSDDQPTGAPKRADSNEGRVRTVITADLAAEDRSFRAALSAERKITIAHQLGVSVAALDSIGIGRANQSDLRRLRASGNGWKESHPLVVSSFPECDATGAVVGFCFRTDDGRKGSPSGKVGAKRGLIIPSTLSTRPDLVLLVEGPTDVAACETLGIAAVGRPSNASGGSFIAQLLARREVLVVGENDQNPAGTWPGREGAEKLANHLARKWKRQVGWALPPEGFKDARSYLQHLVANGLDLNDERACHEAGKQFVETLTTSASIAHPPIPPSRDERQDDGGAREVVLRLCIEAGDHLFHDNESRAYALVREKGIARTLSVRSRDFGLLLGRRFYQAIGSGLPSAAKTEAIATLEGLALFDGPEEPVFVRIGEYEDKIVLDLCDAQWRVVVISCDGWEVVNESPIRFRRTRGMLALPVPVRGGSISDLRTFINVRTDSDFVLVCAFILVCFSPLGPFFILLVNGEQGSAKSTLCRLIRALIDPNKAPLRSEPKDNRDLAIAANNAWSIALDNMSRVSERISNALCRLATGGGFSTRELFSDSDEMIFDAKRPILINGIGEVADRSDLLDRALRLTLPTIPEDRRDTERAIWSRFEKKRAAILGAFLDAVSVALRNRDAVRFTKLPRMADSATWVVAAESACPWEPGAFIEALDDQRKDADEFVIEASPLATAIRERLEHHEDIEGTATEILEILSAGQDEKISKHVDWPKSAPALGTKLREVAPNLRRLGIEIGFGRNGAERKITIRRAEKPPESLSLLSSLSPTPPNPAAGTRKEGGNRPSGDSDSSVGDSDPAPGDGDTWGLRPLKPGNDSNDSNDSDFPGISARQ